MPFLKSAGLRYAYPDAPSPAIKGVDLSLERGEYLSVVGANGSGKSTLSRLLAGLILPSEGSVELEGTPSSAEAFREKRPLIGFLFQSPLDQIVGPEALLDAAFAPENLGLPPVQALSRAREALKAVGLEGTDAVDPRLLSPGQQQLLCLAGILAADPACLILDEASSMLDPASRARLLSILDELHAAGRSIISVTQSMDEAARAGRCLVMEGGRIVFDGSPSELFSSESLHAWGLELPPALAFLRALGLPNPRPEALPALEEAADALLASGLHPRHPSPSAGERPSRDEGRLLLECRGLAFRYPRGGDAAHEPFALEGVDFSLHSGEMVAVAGGAGSGKSTLLQLAASLLIPSEGRVNSLGVATEDPRLDAPALRRRSAMALQRPEDALFESYAADDAAFGPRCAGSSGKELLDRVMAAFGLVGLDWETFRDRHPRSLSGGERRRLALAGILALGPEILILDEASSSLDPEGRSRLLSLLARLAASGVAVLYASHDMEEVAMADRVLVLAAGKLAFDGPPEELFQEGKCEALSLDLPFAPGLRAACARRGWELPPLLLIEDALSTFGDPSRTGKEGRASAVAAQALLPPPLASRPLLGKRARKRKRNEFFLLDRLLLPGESSHGRLLGPLPPGGKYLWLLALALPAMISPGISIPLAVFCLALLAAAAEGARPLRVMKGILPALPFLSLYALLLFFLPEGGRFLPPPGISLPEALALALILARLAALMALFGTFAAITPVSELAHGMEDALKPLSPSGRLSSAAGLSAGIVFRFIPLLAEEAERIMRAQAARGSPGYSGSPSARLRTAASLVVPLFIRAIERSEALAMAMEARLWPGKGRRRSREYRATGAQRLLMASFLLLGLALTAGAFILP